LENEHIAKEALNRAENRVKSMFYDEKNWSPIGESGIKSMFYDEENWVSLLPDDKKISMFTLPGTHDSCARIDPGSCQKWSLDRQLNAGIRFIDIRGRHIEDVLAIHHGMVYQKMMFGDVLNICFEFLKDHPKEFILMSLKDEYDAVRNTRSYEETVKDYIHRCNPSKWYTGTDIPELKDVRGKIVLVRRFEGSIGLNWKSSSLFTIQDDYEVPGKYFDPSWEYPFGRYGPDIDWKWTRVKNLLDKANREKSDNKFYVSFASGYWNVLGFIPNVEDISDGINPKVRDYFRLLPVYENSWACIVPMDFPDDGTIDVVILQCLRRFNLIKYPLCRIYNTHQKEYLYAADYKPFDKDRRRVFTWRPGDPVKQGYWRLIPIGGGEYYIYNDYQEEYLYAADYKPFDKDRRRVFTWRPGGPVNQGRWKFEQVGNEFWIKNTYQSEYLYAADYKPFDKDRRRVFTWRPGGPVNQGYWRVVIISEKWAEEDVEMTEEDVEMTEEDVEMTEEDVEMTINNWLEGRTDGTVGLAPSTQPPHTGTKWNAQAVGDGVYAFKCLGEVKGNIWLEGRTNGAVGLAPSTQPPYTGTKWKAWAVDKMVYMFECLGEVEGNIWLEGRTNGTVGLAPSTQPPSTSTRWQIVVDKDIYTFKCLGQEMDIEISD
jgi:1-phosphatidylinositol phosphodiesterase